ncbi:MAG: O-antigen ligase family protein [Chloroflexota bacterium]
MSVSIDTAAADTGAAPERAPVVPRPARRASDLALEVGWLALALLVPVTFQRWSYDAFELPKQIVTFIVLEIALLAGVALRLAEFPWQRRGWLSGETVLGWLGGRPAVLAAGSVALAWLLATAVSVAPEQSWWGLPPRWAGARAQMAHVALFAVCALVLTRPDQLLRLASVTAAAGALSSAYALVQRAGRDPLAWGGYIGAQQAADLSIRPPGTFGNPNFLAGYLVLSVFLTLGALLSAKRWWVRTLLCVALLVQVVALIFSQTRGAWLGVVSGAIAFTTCLCALRGGPWRRMLLGAGVVAMVVLVTLRAAQPLVPSGTLLARASNILSVTEETASIRLALWRLAGPRLLDRPWLGFGPDAIGTVFQGIYGRELVEAEGKLGGGSQYDRSENAALDALLAVGGIGALSMLVIELVVARAVAVLVIMRGRVAMPSAESGSIWVPLVASSTAALAAHLTAQQFNVEVVGASFLAWTLAGGLVGLARLRGVSDLSVGQPVRRPLLIGALAGALIVSAGTAWWELRPLRAGVVYEAGLTLQRAGKPAEAIPQLGRANALWPHYYLFWAELGYANRAAGRAAPPGPDKERYYRQAFVAVDRALAINDAHPLVWSYWGDIAAEVALTTGDQGLRARARVAHLRATDLAPNWWRYWQSAGDSDMLLGEFGSAKEKYARAAALTPGNWVLWASLGDAANRSADYPAARSGYERALGLRPGAQTEATIERAIASLSPG